MEFEQSHTNYALSIILNGFGKFHRTISRIKINNANKTADKQKHYTYISSMCEHVYKQYLPIGKCSDLQFLVQSSHVN